jgi:pimeloyl-ACP methyl ester carboxylesterase
MASRLATLVSPWLVLFLAVEIGLPLLLFLGRNRMIFLPTAEPGPEEGLRYLRGAAELSVIRIRRPDGRLLAAYDARPKGVDAGAGPVVVFFHGNAGNIAHRAPLVEDFVAGSGLRTILFDYSGYGGNAGTPSERQVVADGLAVHGHLLDEGVPWQRIVLYGESIGGAVALAVASRAPCGGVIAQSTFSSLSSMAFRVYPWLPLTALLGVGSFPSARHAAALEVPLLVVHGTRDEVIPYAEGRRLHRKAKPGTDFVAIEGAGHNDFFEVAGRPYLEMIGERVRTWTAAQSS